MLCIDCLIYCRFSSDPRFVAFSPDFRWFVLVTVKLDVFQIFLPVFQSSSWSHLHKTNLHAASTALRVHNEDNTPADSRKVLRRVNAIWEREVCDVIAKNAAKQNFTVDGWIFREDDRDSGLFCGDVVSEFRPPMEYAGDWMPLALHCTDTEIYVTAKNSENHILLGKCFKILL